MRRAWFWLWLWAGLSAAGCQALRTTARPAPFPHQLTHEQLVVHSAAPLADEDRLIDELTAQREWLTTKLQLPTTEVPIHVYLFADETAYYDFLNSRYPGFSRRAIFVEDNSELSVCAFWGEYIAEDLRHELSHGYLHAAVPNLPVWLDEGLAEYFEVGSAREGMNWAHIGLLHQQHASGEWQPNLSQLEQLASTANMTQVDYAEAWAWVHFLLESPDNKTVVLTDFLADLRQGGGGARLSTRLHNRSEDPSLALVEHLESLR